MKNLKYIPVVLAVTLLSWGGVSAVSCLTGQQGGTGLCSATSSQVGYTLTISTTTPLTYVLTPIPGTSGSASTTIAGLVSNNFILRATTTLGISTTSPNIINIGPGASYATLNGTATYFPFYTSATGLSSTSSLVQDATGTLWVANGSYPLFVIGTTTQPTGNVLLQVASSGPGFIVTDDGHVGVGTSTVASTTLTISGGGTTSNTDALKIFNSAGNLIMQARNDRRLGVFSAPGSTLSVGGNAAIGATFAGQGAPTNGLIVQSSISIGTTTNAAGGLFNIGTTSTNYFNVTATGNIGIGTINPTSTLHIVVPDGGTQIISTISNSVAGTSGLEFRYNSGIGSNNLARIMGVTQSGGGGDLNFDTAPAGGSAYTTKATLTRAGNFGIGTTTPANLLSIASSSGASLFDFTGAGAITARGGNGSIYQFNDANGTGAIWTTNIGLITGTASHTYIASIGTNDINLSTGATRNSLTQGTIRTTLTSTGLLGIGTTTPPESLSVVGHIGSYSAASGATTTVSACGTSPTFRGTDTYGEVTVGATATSCTVNFANNPVVFINKPVCVVSEQTGSVVNALSYSITTSTLIFTQTGLASQVVDYSCGAI